MSTLAKSIRAARTARALTQGALARRLCVSQSTISLWENGVETPTLEHQVRLIEILPEILSALAENELALLDRIQRLERDVFGGRCACQGCTCSPEEATPRPISRVARGQTR